MSGLNAAIEQLSNDVAALVSARAKELPPETKDLVYADAEAALAEGHDAALAALFGDGALACAASLLLIERDTEIAALKNRVRELESLAAGPTREP